MKSRREKKEGSRRGRGGGGGQALSPNFLQGGTVVHKNVLEFMRFLGLGEISTDTTKEEVAFMDGFMQIVSSHCYYQQYYHWIGIPETLSCWAEVRFRILPLFLGEGEGGLLRKISNTNCKIENNKFALLSTILRLGYLRLLLVLYPPPFF